MSAYSISKRYVEGALNDAQAAGIPVDDLLHALLVTVTQAYKSERGLASARDALEFQMNNLADDLDYEFMRP